ncbi:MAG: bifunctional hydroxymethylpyrimidine kinase/phosphomethylpyrimidine kinase [Alphaproteobacteria bacterium]|nr:bifunctional hydroxymethylpyrimidine kinase/phosphomethylpyrimidine kinase [Alphaproteobacteria bacterium]
MRGRVLIVAGSDSGGGAGIQADIKTVTALAGYAATAITALTAQDTTGVHGVMPVPPGFIARQMRVVLRDIGADAIKTGMLHDSATIDAVSDVLEAEAGARDVPLVVDPVMYAKGGHPLLQPEAVATLKRRLLVLARVLTPNLPEAEALSGMRIRTLDDMRHAARTMVTLGCQAVLLKGGHMEGDTVVDVLATESGIRNFESQRIASKSTHGTGCTLASAIATGLAQGLDLEIAVARAREYVRRAIETAPGIGKGHGPLNHAHTVRQS